MLFAQAALSDGQGQVKRRTLRQESQSQADDVRLRGKSMTVYRDHGDARESVTDVEAMQKERQEQSQRTAKVEEAMGGVSRV